MPGDFKELVEWQRAMDLIVEVYRATRHFPADERFGLTNRVRRAVVSIASKSPKGKVDNLKVISEIPSPRERLATRSRNTIASCRSPRLRR